MAGKPEVITGLQLGDKPLFDGAQGFTPHKLDPDAGIADDGSDRHPVPHGDPLIRHFIDPMLYHYLFIFVVRIQTGTAGLDKTQYPGPFFGQNMLESIRLSDFFKNDRRFEAIRNRQCNQILDQHVERTDIGRSLFNAAFSHCTAKGGPLQKFERVGRHKIHLTNSTRLVSTPAGSLQKAGDPFGTANLYHRFYRPKIYAQIQTRSTHHGFEQTLVKGILHPIAQGSADRPVVHGNSPGQIRCHFQQLLVPDLALCPGIGKNQRTLALFDDGQHLFQHLDPQVSCPGESLYRLRQKGFDGNLFSLGSPDQTGILGGAPVAKQNLHGLLQIAQGGGDTPGF